LKTWEEVRIVKSLFEEDENKPDTKKKVERGDALLLSESIRLTN